MNDITNNEITNTQSIPSSIYMPRYNQLTC